MKKKEYFVVNDNETLAHVQKNSNFTCWSRKYDNAHLLDQRGMLCQYKTYLVIESSQYNFHDQQQEEAEFLCVG